MLEAAEAARVGARGAAFEVSRADGGTQATSVSVAVDYAGFSRAYGGDFATRLTLAMIPRCAAGLAPGSCGATLVKARNDLDQERIEGAVTVASDPDSIPADSGFQRRVDMDSTDELLAVAEPAMFSVTSTATGTSGSFEATPFQPSDLWQVGVSSGNFSYSYQVPLPPPVGGRAPTVALGYSSQAVDGRTSATSGQVSQVGQGWSFDNGYIERKFAACANDGHPGWADLCWSGSNEYFLNYNGRSDRMVRLPNTSEWRLRDDPAWRILSYKGAPNGDNDGEYFVVITPDGTKHYFGSGSEAGGATPRLTNSTYTVPVMGDGTDPCATALDDRFQGVSGRRRVGNV